jgi:[acyl-carrier-protein] S-malonyltransferase
MRGQLMQDAAPEGVGAMAAVLGAEDALVEEVCEQAGDHVVVPANYNSPGQIVIGGDVRRLMRARELAERGVRKAVKLAVSVPSHTPLMREAANRLAEAMRACVAHAGTAGGAERRCPRPRRVDAIRDALVRQLYQPVRWTRMRAGAGRCRRDAHRRVRAGQGADRPGQAHRQIA